PVQLLSESYCIELILDCPMEAFTNTIALRAFHFCFRVLNIFNSQVEFVLMVLSFATVFSTPIGKNAQQRDLLFLKKWNDFVIKHISGSNGILTIIQLGHGNFRISVYESLLIDSAYTLDVANVVGVLCA